MSLRVGLDARLASRGLGISTMLVEVARCLAPRVELVWYGDPDLAPPGVAAAKALRAPFPVFDSRIGHAVVRRDRIDVLHFAANCGWTAPDAIPTVLTVHDLIFMTTDSRGRALRQALGHRYMRLIVPRAARVATVLTSPSRASAGAVERAFARPVLVVPNGVTPPEPVPTTPGEDVVVFSGRDPRKGTLNAIHAWRASGVRRRLVILAGAGLPDGFEEAADQDVALGRIVIRNYLPRNELWAVLGSASALLHMSEHEGFGLPALEAMSVGVPVIGGLSDAGREVAGDDLIQIDAVDPVGSAAAALRQLDAEPATKEALIQAGLRRARRWTWSRAADGYLSAYSAAVERR